MEILGGMALVVQTSATTGQMLRLPRTDGRRESPVARESDSHSH
jgi:hypothetical protein